MRDLTGVDRPESHSRRSAFSVPRARLGGGVWPRARGPTRIPWDRPPPWKAVRRQSRGLDDDTDLLDDVMATSEASECTACLRFESGDCHWTASFASLSTSSSRYARPIYPPLSTRARCLIVEPSRGHISVSEVVLRHVQLPRPLALQHQCQCTEEAGAPIGDVDQSRQQPQFEHLPRLFPFV